MSSMITTQPAATAHATPTYDDALTPFVVPLESLRAADAGCAGAKAANLGDMLRVGFVVPHGVAITTRAFRRFVADLGVEPSREAILAALLPEELERSIIEGLGDLVDAPVAVRSSSVAEDLDGASFAGQYDTFLDVRGADAIIMSIKQCWASVFGARVLQYREEQGLDIGDMAVLVQRLVAADAAGVCFTANPVTGARDEVLVSAVKGLGERLVSGEASPDEWTVTAAGARCAASPEKALTEAQVEAVAALGRRVQAHFGTPQDIEWAREGEALVLLQARPITALPPEVKRPDVALIPIPIEPPEGYWVRESSHMPQPLSPLFGSVFLPTGARVMREVMAETGMMLETVDHAEIGGLAYMRLVPLGGKERKPPPAWLLKLIGPLMIRVVPSLRKRIGRAVEVARADWYWTTLEQWWSTWRGHFDEAIEELKAVDRDALDLDGARDFLRRAVVVAMDAMEVHTKNRMAMGVVQARFFMFAVEALGWSEEELMALFTGLSEMSTGPAVDLAPLVERVEASAELRARIANPTDATAAQLAATHPEFAAALSAYQEQWGCRAIRLDILDPNMDETPALTLRLLHGVVTRGFDAAAVRARARADREALLDKARQRLASASEDVRQRFETDFARCSKIYPMREDDELYTMSAPMALVRRAALEVGKRLVGRGVIERSDDVFYLREAELDAACCGDGEWPKTVRRRRGERAWALSQLGNEPRSFGDDPGPPPEDMSWLPSEIADLMDCMMWFARKHMAMERADIEQDGRDGIEGIAAAAGVYEGTVRVIANESEFGKLRPNDVLVCPTTSPVWSVLFSNVGALVTDAGGILSHPAIIAREFGIPAVVATGNATALLEDGQRVVVDGNRGRVDLVT